MLKNETNSNPRVLVGSPVFDGTRYCIKAFIDKIRSLSYNNYDIFLVDNSINDDFFRELKKEKGIKVEKDYTKEAINKKRLVSSRNKILKHALDSGYDYVLMMDSDVIPPVNIIEELLSCEKNIVSGLYFNYFVSSDRLKYLPVAWQFITREEFEEMKKTTVFPPVVKSHLDLRRHLIPQEYEGNSLINVMSPSAGCMLIKKKVFERIKYGLLDVQESTGDDIYFATKAREAGFKIYCYTKIKCEHLVKGKYKKDKEGNLIHPLYE